MPNTTYCVRILYQDLAACKKFTHSFQIFPFIQSIPRHSAPNFKKIENQKVALTTFISTPFPFATLNLRVSEKSFFNFEIRNRFQAFHLCAHLETTTKNANP